MTYPEKMERLVFESSCLKMETHIEFYSRLKNLFQK